jgi:hypothetical protein
MAKIEFVSSREYVEGLGDEEVPWWIGPYVRDLVGLARSSAIYNATFNADRAGQGIPTPQPARAALLARIVEVAAFARIASHIQGGSQWSAGAGAALQADTDEFCGTPPRPRQVGEAALAVALVAASLSEKDPARNILINETERLQKLAAR